MLSDKQLEEIQNRYDKTTPGVWELRGWRMGCSVYGGDIVLFGDTTKADGEFAAHSHQDIPALLEELKFFKNVVADMQEESDKIRLYTRAERENKALREFLKEVHKLVPQAVEMIARRSDREGVAWLSNLS